jgi:hypothetical protein
LAHCLLAVRLSATACLLPSRLAPLPPKKVTVVEETMATGLEFLAQSK